MGIVSSRLADARVKPSINFLSSTSTFSVRCKTRLSNKNDNEKVCVESLIK